MKKKSEITGNVIFDFGFTDPCIGTILTNDGQIAKTRFLLCDNSFVTRDLELKAMKNITPQSSGHFKELLETQKLMNIGRMEEALWVSEDCYDGSEFWKNQIATLKAKLKQCVENKKENNED